MLLEDLAAGVVFYRLLPPCCLLEMQQSAACNIQATRSSASSSAFVRWLEGLLFHSKASPSKGGLIFPVANP